MVQQRTHKSSSNSNMSIKPNVLYIMFPLLLGLVCSWKFSAKWGGQHQPPSTDSPPTPPPSPHPPTRRPPPHAPRPSGRSSPPPPPPPLKKKKKPNFPPLLVCVSTHDIYPFSSECHRNVSSKHSAGGCLFIREVDHCTKWQVSPALLPSHKFVVFFFSFFLSFWHMVANGTGKLDSPPRTLSSTSAEESFFFSRGHFGRKHGWTFFFFFFPPKSRTVLLMCTQRYCQAVRPERPCLFFLLLFLLFVILFWLFLFSRI